MKTSALASFCVGMLTIAAIEVPNLPAEEPKPPADAPDPNLPNVLLIGDSISIGYAPHVKAALKGKANVIRNEGNAVDTVNGLAKIDSWLGETKWQVIHFNWGLHDMKQGGTQVPLEKYTENMEKLVERLKKTGAVLIFATTTPVPEKNREKRRESGVVAYNAAAVKIMEKNGVLVNDLHVLVAPHQGEWQNKDNVHFKDSSGMGKAVAEKIAGALSAAPEPRKDGK